MHAQTALKLKDNSPASGQLCKNAPTLVIDNHNGQHVVFSQHHS